jgi:murein DD-endopeptidase MepM/ murein hydrolase activator NlpD
MPLAPPSSTRPHRRRCPVAVLTAVLLVATWCVAAPSAAAGEEPQGVWPLEPRPEVVRGFDPPDVPWGRGHRGVDLAGHVGQPVRAALPGTVSFAGHVAGRGVVVVDHGVMRTTYEPVTASVRRGADVGRGQVIGTLGWFGTHCLPAACLHWGLRAGDTYLDPLQLVGGPLPVRLLPLGGGTPVDAVRAAPLSLTTASSGAPSPGTPWMPAPRAAWSGSHRVALGAAAGAVLAALTG